MATAKQKSDQKPKEFDPVVVTWEDASSNPAVQFASPAVAIAAYKPTLRKTYGMYVGLATTGERKALILASDDDRSDEEPTALGGPQQIPLGMVISIEIQGSKRR
jgi:hypothetical protein